MVGVHKVYFIGIEDVVESKGILVRDIRESFLRRCGN
jgi:hypothetical protein